MGGEVTWSVSDASIIEVFSPVAGSSAAELPSVEEVTGDIESAAVLFYCG
jgi:hypothetical protein